MLRLIHYGIKLFFVYLLCLHMEFFFVAVAFSFVQFPRGFAFGTIPLYRFESLLYCFTELFPKLITTRELFL